MWVCMGGGGGGGQWMQILKGKNCLDASQLTGTISVAVSVCNLSLYAQLPIPL